MEKTELTPAELAARWEITELTLAQWRWTGRGPRFRKIGRQIKYRLKDIELFEEQQVRNSTSDREIFYTNKKTSKTRRT